MIEENLSIGTEAGVETTAGAGTGTEASAGGATTDGTEAAATVELHPLMQAMTTNMKLSGVDYKAPDGFNELTPEKQFEVFRNEIISNSDLNEDDFIVSYKDAKQKGVDQDAFIESYQSANSLYKLESKEFMMRYYQANNGKTDDNPNGWTKEDIEAHVDGMGKIQLDMEANGLKKSMQDAKKTQKVSPEDQAQVNERLKVANEAILEESTKLFSKVSKLNDIGGIPHTVEDQKEFHTVFNDLIGLNPETGRARVQELLGNDEVLYKALYLLHKAETDEGSIKGFLSGFKEEYKKEILDKTRINPRIEKGNLVTSKVPKHEDYV